MNKALYTYEEAAHLLSFRCKRTIERLVERGDLRAVYPRPRSPRIAAAEITDYVQRLSDPYTVILGSHASEGEKDVCKRKTGSTKGKTHRTGGVPSSTGATGELGALLGFDKTH